MKRFVSSVIFSLVSINTLLMADSTRPKLVVGIMVDQLRTDYIEYLSTLFGRNGFNRLMKEGVYLKDVDFRGSANDPATATAVVLTGSWPSTNGMASAESFDETQKRLLPTLIDKSARSNFASEGYSPIGLMLSTVTDEVAIDGAGLGKIYSFSADPQQAVILASHAGSGALWIDENNGRWVSSNYYSDFPSSISAANRTSPLSQRVGSMQWKPLLSLSAYPGIPAQKKQFAFSYTFPLSDRNVYRKFNNSPLSNKEVTDAALSTLREMKLGNRTDAIDMLNVAYTAAPYKFADNEDYRIELEDTYIRLDSELERLFAEIDSAVGLDNTFIFLASTGYYDDAAPDNERYRIPSGEFSSLKAESLLNSYLSATYGNGDFVSRISDGKLYLDRKLIDRKGLDINRISREARDFLSKMSGVAGVYTLDDIRQNLSKREMENLSLSIDSKKPADLYLLFTPGWIVTDDAEMPAKSKVVRLSTPPAPAFILYPSLLPQEVTERVEATVLAPTITSSLHIRAPNGAGDKPLSLKTK